MRKKSSLSKLIQKLKILELTHKEIKIVVIIIYLSQKKKIKCKV